MSTLYVDNLEPNLGSRVLAAGHVVQVVSSHVSTSYSGTAGSEVYVGTSASITPTSTSSKILINVPFGTATTGSYSNYAIRFNLRRGTTTSDQLLSRVRFGRYDNQTNTQREAFGSCVLAYLDSPATTSSVTYGIFVENIDGAPFWYVNPTSGSTTWTLMEIAQ